MMDLGESVSLIINSVNYSKIELTELICYFCIPMKATFIGKLLQMYEVFIKLESYYYLSVHFSICLFYHKEEFLYKKYINMFE